MTSDNLSIYLSRFCIFISTAACLFYLVFLFSSLVFFLFSRHCFLDSGELFQHCPFLLPHGEDVQKVLEQWKEYKMGVPTYGAIILDETLEHVSDCIIAPWLSQCGVR